MAVLDRSELEASPLADLHAIANQVGLDGFRRLRKAELIDTILGEPTVDRASEEPAERSAPRNATRPPRGRVRGARGANGRGEDGARAVPEVDRDEPAEE